MKDNSVGSVVSHLQHNKLGTGAIVFFVLAAVAPIGSILGGSPVVFGAAGKSAPATYVVVGCLFLLFAFGYLAMSRHIAHAGGFVTYVSHGLGTKMAAVVGAIALLAYFSLVCGFWGFFGGITGFISGDLLGVVISAPVSIAAILALVTLLTYLGVDVSLRVLGTLLVFEMGVLVILAVAIVVQGGASGIEFSSFSPKGLFVPGIGIALLFATTSFTGFEATVVFSEEAKDPDRTIPRATYISVFIIALFYAIVTFTLALGYGTDEVQNAANANPEGFVFELAGRYVGGWFVTFMTVLILTSLLAMFLGFHSIAARYVFTLARAGLLPDYFGQANAKSGSPNRAILFTSAIVALVVGGFLFSGADSMTVVYPWLASLGTVSIQTMLVITSISVVAFFLNNKVDTRIWHTRIAPGLAALGFLATAYISISNYDALLGGQGGVARWLLLLIPIVGTAGWVVASMPNAKSLDFQKEPE